jgi:Ala-tRNA(Pro) deacylase
MSILKRLRQYLDSQKIPYEILSHKETHTAPELAQTLHVPGKDLAKIVMLKVDGRDVMSVLPANWKADVKRLKDVFGTNHVRLATEQEFKDLFPDCELGAIPPFGNLYGLGVYVDQSLTKDDDIIFPAGNSREAVKLRYRDFADLVQPLVADFHESPLRHKAAS